ncbi:MAG TPA: outer membrane protein, partial [Stellaceae bacterium]|nr:outer membrane protein [Stellaceae bacterium]
MKRLMMAVVAGAGLILSAGAHAQFNGPEIGIQGGYGWGTSSGDPGGNPKLGYSFSPDGGMGGAHAGYNWQFGPWLLGLEGDAEGGSISGNGAIGTSVYSVHSNMDFDASIRGKLGFAFNRVLLYGTGGAAFGDVSTDYLNGVGAQFASSSGIRVGWTAGGGAEYAVTPNWDVGLEYRYTDLGHESATGSPAPRIVLTDSNQFTYSMVRLALSYRFA